MSSPLIAFRADDSTHMALEDLRRQHGLKSVSQAARVAMQLGLSKLDNVSEAIRKAAYDEGVAAGRSAFRAKLAVLFSDTEKELAAAGARPPNG